MDKPPPPPRRPGDGGGGGGGGGDGGGGGGGGVMVVYSLGTLVQNANYSHSRTSVCPWSRPAGSPRYVFEGVCRAYLRLARIPGP